MLDIGLQDTFMKRARGTVRWDDPEEAGDQLAFNIAEYAEAKHGLDKNGTFSGVRGMIGEVARALVPLVPAIPDGVAREDTLPPEARIRNTLAAGLVAQKFLYATEGDIVAARTLISTLLPKVNAVQGGTFEERAGALGAIATQISSIDAHTRGFAKTLPSYLARELGNGPKTSAEITDSIERAAGAYRQTREAFERVSRASQGNSSFAALGARAVLGVQVANIEAIYGFGASPTAGGVTLTAQAAQADAVQDIARASEAGDSRGVLNGLLKFSTSAGGNDARAVQLAAEMGVSGVTLEVLDAFRARADVVGLQQRAADRDLEVADSERIQALSEDRKTVIPLRDALLKAIPVSDNRFEVPIKAGDEVRALVYTRAELSRAQANARALQAGAAEEGLPRDRATPEAAKRQINEYKTKATEKGSGLMNLVQSGMMVPVLKRDDPQSNWVKLPGGLDAPVDAVFTKGELARLNDAVRSRGEARRVILREVAGSIAGRLDTDFYVNSTGGLAPMSRVYEGSGAQVQLVVPHADGDKTIQLRSNEATASTSPLRWVSTVALLPSEYAKAVTQKALEREVLMGEVDKKLKNPKLQEGFAKLDALAAAIEVNRTKDPALAKTVEVAARLQSLGMDDATVAKMAGALGREETTRRGQEFRAHSDYMKAYVSRLNAQDRNAVTRREQDTTAATRATELFSLSPAPAP
jgi:hypothetical protein